MSTDLPDPLRSRNRARSRRARPACAAIGVAVLCGLLGCHDGPGRLGASDASVRLDSGTDRGDGAVASLRRDGGPDLPYSDRQVELALGAPETVITYDVAASPDAVDVHLSIDTTGSFVEEIDAVQASLLTTIVPSIRTIVPNSSFGVSFFQDFPAPPFGASADRPFVLLQRVTSSITSVKSAVDRFDERIGNGGDVPESGYEALYQIATGAGYETNSQVIVPRFSGNAATGGGLLGGVGFRDEAFKIVVHATDAIAHDSTAYDGIFDATHGGQAATDALALRSIHVIGITEGSQPRAQLTDLAIATRTVVPPTNGSCPTGVMGTTHPPVDGVCPLVFDVNSDGTGLSSALVDAVSRLVSNVTFQECRGTASDDRLGFVTAIEASGAVPPPGIAAPSTTDHTLGDGYDDTFVSVPSATILTFRVHLANSIFASQSYEQTFRVRIRIEADGSVIVDEWIRVVIPATP